MPEEDPRRVRAGKLSPAEEDQERFALALEEHDNPAMPIVWSSPYNGIVWSCPNCHEMLDTWLSPKPGQMKHLCDPEKGGCGATWERDENGLLVSSLGECPHTVLTVEVRQISTWAVLGKLPKDHGYPDENAWLLRYFCPCGHTHDRLAPEPGWRE
jgi:hypothetical protein